MGQEPLPYTLSLDVGLTRGGRLWLQVFAKSCTTALTHHAIDIDGKSLEYAQRNVHSNGLYRRINVVRSDPAGSILCHVLSGHPSISVNGPGLVNHHGTDISEH